MTRDARRAAVATPLGPGVSLYAALVESHVASIEETRSWARLMLAVYERAEKDVAWLDAVEARPRSEWTKFERELHRDMLDDGVIEPRAWLAEQREEWAAGRGPLCVA